MKRQRFGRDGDAGVAWSDSYLGLTAIRTVVRCDCGPLLHREQS